MKKRWQILALMMIMFVLSTMQVFAEENIDETDIYMNPFYGDEVVIEEELLDASAASVEGIVCSSWDEMAAHVRETMKNREAKIVLQYTSLEPLPATWLRNLLDSAMIDTSTGSEGDYIDCHFGGCKSSRRTSQSNGMYISQITLNFTYYTTAEQEAYVDQRVQSLLGSFNFTSSTSDYDKVNTIYRWICNNVSYDYKTLNDSSYKLKFTAYAALANRTAVCQGFAALGYRLFKEAGVDARVITGTSSGEKHAWLIVELDGLYYNLDAAWDSGRTTFKYFLNTEAQFTNHKRAAEYTTDAFNQQYPMAVNDYAYNKAIAPIKAFVSRLYVECLNRVADTAGLNDWAQKLKNGELTGVSAASGIVFSQEFKNRGLSNDAYVEILYKAFMGRSSDPGGKSHWMGLLSSGMSREEVFNGFAMSAEFGKICAEYGIKQGSPIPVPAQGSVGSSGGGSNAGDSSDITGFVQRLYRICLNREADEGGLADWTGQLKNRTNSGRGVAYGFVFSPEFVNKNHSNADYVEYLYNAFMDRASDPGGKADWLNRMEASGWTREQVFDGFAGSQEFTNICESYGIRRD